MLFVLYRLSRRARQAMLAEENYPVYFKILALECALLGFLVTGSFINQFRAEVLYWMVLLVAVGTNVYYLQPSSSVKRENSDSFAVEKLQSGSRS
ncbi:hypothetical protein CF392_16440 [Tamilnaduibacter salinus]|uniref:Uncharacterized protein n=1 Tax=Tamilnaduibacter salinus TaxID=1484056 RepID=A0A2A2HYZ4_9GAMM|nr:hypothetical protein CF392_16440 [Tamilnaduibacter salinus]